MLEALNKLRTALFAPPSPDEIEERALAAVERELAQTRVDVVHATERAELAFVHARNSVLAQTRRELFAAERNFEEAKARVEMLRLRHDRVTNHPELDHA